MDNITNINLGACPLQYLSVGYVGETGARPVSFDFSAWATEYGAGVLQLLLQRPGDANPYPVVLDIDGTTATWTPDATATEKTGQGQAQLVYTVGGVIVKNAVFRVLIAPSLGAAGDPPEPYEDWLERLLTIAAEAQQSALDAAESAEAAGTSAGAAAGSAGAAAQSALDAEAAKSGAEAAEQTAQQAATLARAKAAQAAEAAQIAGREADYAQQQNIAAGDSAASAHDDAELAAQSAEDAQAAASASQTAATAAGASADSAEESADNAEAAVTEVETKGAEQITAINQAGTTQIAAVDAAGAAQAQAIEDKGEEVIASIPPDYTELADDVSDLKSSFDNILDIHNEFEEVTVSYESAAADFFEFGSKIYTRSDVSKWFKSYSIVAGEAIKLKGSSSGEISYIYCFADGSLRSGSANIINNSYTTVSNGDDIDLTAPSGASYICVTSSDDITVSVKKSYITSERLNDVDSAITEIEKDVIALNSDTDSLLDDVTGLKLKTEKSVLIVDTWAAFPFRKQASFTQSNPFTVSGVEGASIVSIEAGEASLIDSDIRAAIVIEHDDGTYRPYIITAYTTNTISVFPALHKNVTSKSLVPFLNDSQHLSANGFKAYMQYIFAVTPKHCEKRRYIDRFCPMSSGEISSDNPFTRLSGTPVFYGAAKNDGLNSISTQRGPYVAAIIPYKDYLTESEYGVYWEVSTGSKSGYLESFIGTDYTLFASNGFHLVKDAGYEMYIEVYADDVLIYSKIKTTNIVERICVDYTSEQDKIKLKIYYKKMRSQIDTLTIGETTFWVNEVYPSDIFPKEATISMLFDSWGEFFENSTINQPADCWHIAYNWKQGASGEELKRLMTEKAGFATPVFNTSHSGATSRWGKSWLGVAVKDHNPNVMLTDFGINDYNTSVVSTFSDEIDPYGNVISMSTPLTMEEYANNMKYIFESCAMSGIQPVFISGNIASSILWIQYLENSCCESVT